MESPAGASSALAPPQTHSKKRKARVVGGQRKRLSEKTKKKRAYYLRAPSRHLSDKLVQEFRFVNRIVRNCINADVTNKRFAASRKRLEELFLDTEVAHDITNRVLTRFRKMCPTADDAGGRVPEPGILLQTHAIWALSLDRIDNTKPHFMYDYLKLLDNLNFVILGMNNQSCIVSKYGKNTCAEVRRKMKERPTREQVNAALDALLSVKASKYKERKATRSIRHAWKRDKIARKHFNNNFVLFFEYCKNLLVLQDYMCALSGIFMGKEGQEKCFQCSLDAIDPKLGHVPGNLRWVCYAFNPIDMGKTLQSASDMPTRWTHENFKYYFNV